MPIACRRGAGVPDGLPLPCFDFADAIETVQEGRADCAIIPIENSLHGRVADIHFLLPESGLVITGEHFLPIRHALMGVGTRDDVREAMSHPQAIGQCRHWLRAHAILPVAYPDTAGAAAVVAERGDPALAALAPPGAAAIYGLNLLAEDIADADHNTTRFVVLARGGTMPVGEGPFMTTLIFEVKNVPAALYKALGGFATNGVNMTKLKAISAAAASPRPNSSPISSASPATRRSTARSRSSASIRSRCACSAPIVRRAHGDEPADDGGLKSNRRRFRSVS